MQYGRFGFPKKLGLIPLMFALALIVACAGTAAEPQVIEKEVIVEKIGRAHV